MFPSNSSSQYKRCHHKAILLAVTGVLATGILSGCGKEDMHSEKVQVFSTVNSITEDYDHNAVGADSTYKGHIVEVTGVVDKIDTVLGKPSVTLRGSSSKLVQCDFNDDTGLAGLSPGQTVKIKGNCNGEFIYVVLSDSVIN